ncbi:F-box domain-containing protein [Plasmodiophora brassicae]|uniref:F-box domain-containing protein n=1 Tax=Plasmodiophora brassicae TaxID=37360 RepID=A0A3P3Y5V8_PLABS|nr:unnamed protein product [Plasmodiophora brassicae]
MAGACWRLHLRDILEYIGPTRELSIVARTCKLWRSLCEAILGRRDVFVDCFSSSLKYYDPRYRAWYNVDTESPTSNPLALLLAEDVITVVDTHDLIVRQYLPVDRTWITITPVASSCGPSGITHFSCCHWRGNIFFSGGRHVDTDDPTAHVWRFNLESRTWRQLPALPIAFVSSVSAVMPNAAGQHCLVVIGSTIDQVDVQSLGFALDLSPRGIAEWQPLPAPPSFVLRFNSRCVLRTPTRLVIGMWTDARQLRTQRFSLIEFDSVAGKWLPMYPIPPAPYIFPALVTKQIAALALDQMGTLISLEYSDGRKSWTVDRPPAGTATAFSLLLGAPLTSIRATEINGNV